METDTVLLIQPQQSEMAYGKLAVLAEGVAATLGGSAHHDRCLFETHLVAACHRVREQTVGGDDGGVEADLRGRCRYGACSLIACRRASGAQKGSYAGQYHAVMSAQQVFDM